MRYGRDGGGDERREKERRKGEIGENKRRENESGRIGDAGEKKGEEVKSAERNAERRDGRKRKMKI